MKIALRIAFVACFCGYAFAEDPSSEPTAEDLLIDFVSRRNELGPNFLAVGKAIGMTIQEGSEVPIRDLTLDIIEAGSRNDQNRELRYSGLSIGKPTRRVRPSWRQLLRIKDTVYFRDMAGVASELVKPENRYIKEKFDVPPEDSQISDGKHFRDPYYLAGSPYGLWRVRSVGADFESFLRMKIRYKSERIEGSTKIGTWENVKKIEGETRGVDVTFDSKSGLPIRFEWWVKPDNGERRASLTRETVWRMQKYNSKSICLPIALRAWCQYSMGGKETTTCLRWKEIEKGFKYPKPAELDWREPFRKTLEHDWQMTFEQFADRYDIPLTFDKHVLKEN